MNEYPDQQAKKPFLYIGVCGSGIADGVGRLIGAAQEAGWGVGVIATPQGLSRTASASRPPPCPM